MDDDKYYVQIVEYGDDGIDTIIKTMGPFNTERQAQRCADGAEINMNHSSYYTTIETNINKDKSISEWVREKIEGIRG